LAKHRFGSIVSCRAKVGGSELQVRAADLPSLIDGLARKRPHQVEVEPFEMLPGLLGRPHRLPPIVDAAQPCQLSSVERWMPSDSRFTPGAEVAKRCAHRARIGFQRDLTVGASGSRGADVAQQAVDLSPVIRLGVPPPMKTLRTVRPHTAGNADSRSSRSACR